MVFGIGIFSRKPQPAASAPTINQLRTPSPSIDSASIGKANSPAQPESPTPHPPTTPSPPPQDILITDPSALRALILTIPPPILHSYTLARLPSADTPALTALTAFFSSLVPPPRLHCVRCHKSFFDVENADRSCLVPHDDESAEVERVGAGSRGKRTGLGTEYETLWGCCGKMVDGDGDMGPPDGWCYEGMHTTDHRRARFRADATPQDDKLTSCARMRCHDPAPERVGSVRKRARADVVGAEEDSFASSSEEDDRSVRAVKKPRTRRKAPVPNEEPLPPANDTDSMNVDPPAPAPSSAPSKSKSKPRSRAPAKPKSTSTSARSASKPRSTRPKSLTSSSSFPSAAAAPFTPSSPSPLRPAPSSPAHSTASSVKPYVGVPPAALKSRSSAASLNAAASGAPSGTEKSGPKSALMSAGTGVLRHRPTVSFEEDGRDTDVKSGSSDERGRSVVSGKRRELVDVVDTSVDGEQV